MFDDVKVRVKLTHRADVRVLASGLHLIQVANRFAQRFKIIDASGKTGRVSYASN